MASSSQKKFNWTQIKKTQRKEVVTKLAEEKADAFAIVVTRCMYKDGITPSGNFECTIKTPKGTRDEVVKEAIMTLVLEEKLGSYDGRWGGFHFRIYTYVQYTLIVNALKEIIGLGHKLIDKGVPNEFLSKAKPILKIYKEHQLGVYALSEKVYPLKFFVHAIGFSWWAQALARPPLSEAHRPEARGPQPQGCLRSPRARAQAPQGVWRALHRCRPPAALGRRVVPQDLRDDHGHQRPHVQPQRPLRDLRLGAPGRQPPVHLDLLLIDEFAYVTISRCDAFFHALMM